MQPNFLCQKMEIIDVCSLAFIGGEERKYYALGMLRHTKITPPQAAVM
jgi:hypothetical protein